MSIRIPIETYRCVEEARWILRKSVTEVIVLALKEYFERYHIVDAHENRKIEPKALMRDPIEELSKLLSD
jgi:hypothetical protein